MNFRTLVNFLRIRQWYKNLVFFFPLIFSVNAFNFEKLLLTLTGFFMMCFTSSANYIINDLIDLPTDRRNPLKKHRPLVSGAVSKWQAGALAFLLLGISFAISLFLPNNFIIYPLALFASTTLYSWKLKHIPLLDILTIGFNFFIRTVSGGYLINVKVTNWLVLIIFLVALLLALSKRYLSLSLLGKKAISLRPVFRFYTKDLLVSFINIVSSMLLLSYCFYSFMSDNSPFLMYSIPLFFIVIFRYLFLVYSGNKAGLKAELLFKDRGFAYSLISWFVAVFLIFYLAS